MRILFIRQSIFYWSPSLEHGMGVIATILHRAGHQVKIIDNNSFYKYYSDNELLRIVKRYKPDILALNVNTFNARVTYLFLEKIKRSFPGILLVGGGIHMKYYYEEALQHAFDVVVNREGEKVVGPLFAHLEGKTKMNFRKELETIPGISFIKEDGSLYVSTEYPIIANLDEVPFVDYNLFNLPDYFKTKNEPGLMILNGQRGCPYSCTFCSSEERKLDKRLASADYMFRNIMHNYKRHGTRYSGMSDSNFLTSKKRVVEFCNKMIESGLNKNVSLVCQAKVETAIDDRIIPLMKKAGFHRMCFGLERLEPYSLAMINKKTDIKDVHRAFSLLRRHGMDIQINIMLGFPFETVELLKKEKQAFFNLIKEFDIRVAYVCILLPLPGTIIYRDDYSDVRKWYLRPDFNRITKTYYAQVFEMHMSEFVEFNFFNLPQDVLDEMKAFYLKFKKMNYGKYLKRKTVFVSLLLASDRLLAKISRFIYSISPSLELWIFRKITFLRYYFGMLFLGKKIS